MRGSPCIRCGIVRGGRRPARERRKHHGRGVDPHRSFATATPECVPKPLRRSLLEKLKGLFTPKGRKP
jgi:hypothetical protein